MGAVNWLAVAVAAVLATAIASLWHGLLFPAARARIQGTSRSQSKVLLTALVFLLAAIMLGHNFARIGKPTLDVKPWLYFMQTGGVALFFVIPTVALTQARSATEPGRRLLDCGFWLVAYLAMGLTFWLLG